MTRNVIIAGAGPAGLLLAALLMQRNNELSEPLYNITVVDNREDLSKLSTEELSKRFRSWMLGLANHGCEALQACDGLFKEYVLPVGIEVTSTSIFLGAKEMKQQQKADDLAVVIDRNFVVAAIGRFLAEKIAVGNEKYGQCATLYDHKLMYVDYENRRVLVRKDGTDDFYLPYDLLVGCDGIRSCVREAIVKRHNTFEMDVGDIFNLFKAVHINRPPSIDAANVAILPGVFREMTGISLPETGDKINVSAGVPRNAFDKIPMELKSNDPKIVAEFARKNLKAFELLDYDDFAQQWVAQGWNRTGQVHCNFYHSTDINVVLMGDAAHATSPSIGMGMNTALRDAQVFYQLLQKHDDDFALALPDYSSLRVKEGNALSDLALHLYCFDTRQQLLETLHMVIRSFLHSVFPRFVYEHPQSMIGRSKYNLSDVYQQATILGIIGKHRRINNEIRQAHFERTNGMVDEEVLKRSKGPLKSVFYWIAAFVLLAYVYNAVTTVRE